MSGPGAEGLRVLAIVHQADAGPGVFAEEIAARGAALDSWLVAEEQRPPADPAGYDAVMTFGGAMNTHEDESHAWLRPEKELLAGLIESGMPILGACLGTQLVAEAGGGSVRRSASPEIGWERVRVLADGERDPLLGALAPGFEAFQWHSYEAVPPPGSALLADSGVCPQAYRIGERAWGIQFHAEVSAADAEKWIAEWEEDPDAVRIGIDPNALRAETRAKIGAWNALGRALCARFLDAAAG